MESHGGMARKENRMGFVVVSLPTARICNEKKNWSVHASALMKPRNRPECKDSEKSESDEALGSSASETHKHAKADDVWTSRWPPWSSSLRVSPDIFIRLSATAIKKRATASISLSLRNNIKAAKERNVLNACAAEKVSH